MQLKGRHVELLQVSDYISNSSYALDENANAVESINLVSFTRLLLPSPCMHLSGFCNTTSVRRDFMCTRCNHIISACTCFGALNCGNVAHACCFWQLHATYQQVCMFRNAALAGDKYLANGARTTRSADTKSLLVLELNASFQ